MGLIKLKVAQDHLESLANPQKPILGLEELIWNGLDADASEIDVIFIDDMFGNLSQIKVRDNGIGIPHLQCETVFGSLGGSTKRFSQRTPSGRRTHGKSGKGRFRAFSIGKRIEWVSTYRSHDTTSQYSIHATRDKVNEFPYTDPSPIIDGRPGVEVIISDLFPRAEDLRKRSSMLEIGRKLSLYLSSYPNVKLTIDEKLIKLDEYILRTDRRPFSILLPDTTVDQAILTIVEWNTNLGRSLYLCDGDGIAVHEVPPEVKDRSFTFSAYLTSPAVTNLVNSNSLITEMDPVSKEVLKATHEELNIHFRRRESERSVDLVKQWKRSNVYPYKNSDAGPIERAEREVFDICALKVHEYLPGFQKLDYRNQRLTFQLIKEALKTSPSSLKTILEAALGLPNEQQEELANLLERTSLTAIINASKVIMDRLAFLESINELLYGTFKKSLLERTQFQRILVDELWIFGEQYLLGVDDQSLKTLLAKHLKILKREALQGPEADVFDATGHVRILDLMLYRRIPQTTPNFHEHLIVELKAPTCTIGEKEISQIKNYAYAILDDERFDKTQTQWTFLLIGNKLDRYAQHECDNDGKDKGRIKTTGDGKVAIYVKEWSSIVADVKWRYEFFRNSLEYQATTTDGLHYLRQKHAQYLPEMPDTKGASQRQP